MLAGVGNGKVMLWHYMDSKKWCGKAAAEAYRGPVAAALSKEYPARKAWTVLEDNDPPGFRSKVGMAAKTEVGIHTFEIPKRSPAVNVLDFAAWSEVTRRMRAEEARMPASKKETRSDFLTRRRRTAMRLPAAFIDDSIRQMRLRCKRLQDAKGGHFEEGH